MRHKPGGMQREARSGPPLPRCAGPPAHILQSCGFTTHLAVLWFHHTSRSPVVSPHISQSCGFTTHLAYRVNLRHAHLAVERAHHNRCPNVTLAIRKGHGHSTRIGLPLSSKATHCLISFFPNWPLSVRANHSSPSAPKEIIGTLKAVFTPPTSGRFSSAWS